jgi:hypothetical protein
LVMPWCPAGSRPRAGSLGASKSTEGLPGPLSDQDTSPLS